MVTKTLTSSIVKKFIPPRKLNSKKGDNGKVLVVGGSYMSVSYTHLTLPTTPYV